MLSLWNTVLNTLLSLYSIDFHWNLATHIVMEFWNLSCFFDSLSLLLHCWWNIRRLLLLLYFIKVCAICDQFRCVSNIMIDWWKCFGVITFFNSITLWLGCLLLTVRLQIAKVFIDQARHAARETGGDPVGNADIHVVVKELLLVDLRYLLVASSIPISIVLKAHKCCIINALHIAIVHQFVLLDNMLGCRVVYGKHLGRLFYCHTLGLNDVDQILPLLVIYLNVVSLSSKQVHFALIIVLLIFVLIMVLIFKAIHKLTLTTIVTFILHWLSYFSLIVFCFMNLKNLIIFIH